MLLKGTYTVDNIPVYEQYGASPSPDYPSKVETVKDSVEIDVVNKNLALWNENNISFINVVNNSISNNVISVKGNEGMAALGYSGGVTKILFDRELRLNKSYTLSVKVKLLEQGKWSNKIQFWFGSNTSWNSETKVVELATNKYILCTFEFKCKIDKENTLIVYLNGNEIEIDLNSLQIEEGTKATDYVEHQSQTAIMPIQQEMLEEDYVTDVEHHEWGKLELTGEEEWFSNINTGWAQNEHIFGFSFSGIKTNGQSTNVGKVLVCNYFKCDNTSVLVDTAKNLISYYPYLRTGSLLINHQGTSELTDFKAWLKSKSEAGMPVIIYYKLAETLDLELTEEQKAVRDTKLYTYKNITNISLSDELASIDVEYKKDIETIEKNIESRLAALETASTSEEAE